MNLSDHRRKIFGCLIGCSGIAAIGLVGVISFFVWLSRPGDLLDTTRLLGDETVGYVEFTLSEDDPVARELLFELIGVSQQYGQRTSPLPASIQGFLDAQSARSRQKDLDQLFPMVAAWTLSHGAEGELEAHLGTVSVEGLGNRLVLTDWMMGFLLSREAVDESNIAVEKYNGESIYRFSRGDGAAGAEGEVVFFMRGSDIFLVSDVEAARRAVERITEAKADRAPTEFDHLFEGVPVRALRGALLNADGELRRLWERLDPHADGTLLDGIDREVLSVTIEGGFVAHGDPELAATGQERLERSFAATVRFECRSAGCAGSGLVERLEQLAQVLREKDRALQLLSEATPDGLVVRGQARDIVGLVERAGQELVEQAPTFKESIRRKIEEERAREEAAGTASH